MNCTNKLITRLNVQNGFNNETVGNIISKIEDEDGVNLGQEMPENLFEKIIEEVDEKPKKKKKVL